MKKIISASAVLAMILIYTVCVYANPLITSKKAADSNVIRNFIVELIKFFEKDTLDISKNGGMSIVIHASKNEGGIPTSDQLYKIKSILEERLDSKKILERRILVDKEKGNITVEVSMKYASGYFNSKESLEALVSSGVLTFQEVDQGKKDVNGKYLPTNKIIIDSGNIEVVKVREDRQCGVVVELSFNTEGTAKFSEATARLIGKPIGIFMDNRLLQAPTVQTQITNGKVVITQQESVQSAEELARVISLGKMNIKLDLVNVSNISPIFY